MQQPDKRPVKPTDLHQILTPSLKTALLLPPLPQHPRKVFHRSEKSSTDVPLSQHIATRHLRDQITNTTGFNCEIMDVYRSLGEPVIQPQDLILASLQMITVSQGSLEDTTIDTTVVETITIDTTPIDDSTQDPGQNFHILKTKLSQSTRRFNAVKFGMPFTKACIPAAFVSEPDQKREWQTIDPDKASYFKNLLEIHRKDGVSGVSGSVGGVGVGAGVSGDATGMESKNVLEVSYINTHQPVIYDRKQLEQSLNFPIQIEQNSYRKQKVYDQRVLQTRLLEQELARLEHHRKPHFERRMKAFKFQENTLFIDALKQMRIQSDTEKQTDLRKRVTSHEWFQEMLEKLLFNVRKNVTKTELRMMHYIQAVVEDEGMFGKASFIELMSLIPTSEFMFDDIQRILRFVKAKSDAITERDYFDAIELSGHITKT